MSVKDKWCIGKCMAYYDREQCLGLQYSVLVGKRNCSKNGNTIKSHVHTNLSLGLSPPLHLSQKIKLTWYIWDYLPVTVWLCITYWIWKTLILNPQINWSNSTAYYQSNNKCLTNSLVIGSYNNWKLWRRDWLVFNRTRREKFFFRKVWRDRPVSLHCPRRETNFSIGDVQTTLSFV